MKLPERFGVLFSTSLPDVNDSVAELWSEILDLAALAERSGFYSVHLPEHHMREDAYLPQPLTAAAAIAQRTSSVRIGPTVLVAPIRHPVHLAEEAAMVDVLSNGRLILGLGIGNYEPEFRLFGKPLSEQAAIFDEDIEVLLRAWSGEPIVFDGVHFQFDGQLIYPRPVQRPRPPVWIGGMSKPGVRRAARFQLPLILDPVHPVTNLVEWVDLYRQECRKYDYDGEVILLRYGWLGTRDELERDWWPHVRRTFWTYLREIPRIRQDIDPRINAASEANDLKYEWINTDRLLAGTPEEIRQLSAEWATVLGCEHIIVKFQGATGPWREPMAEVISRWGTEVIAREGSSA